MEIRKTNQKWFFDLSWFTFGRKRYSGREKYCGSWKTRNHGCLAQQVPCELLELRQMLTAVVMTDQEQLLLELINRARLNPEAEAARYEIDLNKGLPANTISTAPKQPLAPHQSLTNAAGLHSQDMLDRDYFAHTNLDGLEPEVRAQNAGYPSSAVGENIAWAGDGFNPVDQTEEVYLRHAALFDSPGHRENMLHPPYEEVGTGIRFGSFLRNGTNYNAIMVTENFGIQNINPFITGVVYADNDADNFYSIGEAIRSGTITATLTSGGLTYTTEIGVSGGYGLIVPSGTYDVVSRFELNGTGYESTQTVTVASSNVKVDFLAEDGIPVALTASVTNSSLKETGSPVTSTLTVFRPTATATALTVTLTSGDTTEVTVPATVVIPGGQTSVQTTITAVADGIIDGTQAVVVTASASGSSPASVSLTVADTTVPVFTHSTLNSGTPRPTSSWSAIPNAVSYTIWVDNSSTGQRRVIYQEGLTSPSFTPGSDMPIGIYRLWVRGFNSSGQASPWSSPQTLRVQTAPSVNGDYSTVVSPNIAVTWNNISGAVSYDIWIDQLSTSTRQYYRNTAVGQNSINLTGLEAGRYGIWVRAINSGGFIGNWSPRTHITVSLAPTGLGISATSISDRTTVSWLPLDGVTTYQVWVNNQSNGASAVVNQSAISLTSYQLPVLPAAAYAVWVRGVDAGGYGYAWSTPYLFDIQKAARILTPARVTSSQSPLISWTAVSGATRYELWVSSLDGAGRVIYDAGLNSNSYTPTSNLASGRYRVWVRAFDSSNANTGWTGSYDFRITTIARPSQWADNLLSPDIPEETGFKNYLSTTRTIDELFARDDFFDLARLAPRKQTSETTTKVQKPADGDSENRTMPPLATESQNRTAEDTRVLAAATQTAPATTDMNSPVSL